MKPNFTCARHGWANQQQSCPSCYYGNEKSIAEYNRNAADALNHRGQLQGGSQCGWCDCCEELKRLKMTVKHVSMSAQELIDAVKEAEKK